MSDSKRTPKILYVSTKAVQTINRIEDTHYLDLHNAMTSRTSLFLFTMALGLETIPTDFTQKESFIRTEYLSVKDEAFLYSAFINQLEDIVNIEECVEKDKVFELSQRYVNTGFELINSMIETKPESMVILELIAELDDEYKNIVVDFEDVS